MRIVMIALFAIASMFAMAATPASARTITVSEFETVCGSSATRGVDEYGRTYEYCVVFCGIDGESVCYFRCVASRCEGFIVGLVADPGTPEPPKPPKFADVMGQPGSLSTSGDSGGGGAGGAAGGSKGETHGSFATTATTGGGSSTIY